MVNRARLNYFKSCRIKEKVASSYGNYNNEDPLGIVKRKMFLLKIKLINLYWISIEAGTPLLAVQMYSPFACRSTSTRLRDQPEKGKTDPTWK